MNEGIITNRYAKALFRAGEEENKTEKIKADVESIILTIKESAEFAEFITSPIIKESVKLKLFDEIFIGKVQDITLIFLKLLTKNKREQYLLSVCMQYLYYYKQNQGIKEAHITTAQPLDKAHRDDVLKYIKKKFKVEVDLIEDIDATILGGFKLRIEDEQIDASVASKLRRIRTELINS